jgi:8-oxo-dGTP pyrophosphatase MutT (NUDIX family)
MAHLRPLLEQAPFQSIPQVLSFDTRRPSDGRPSIADDVAAANYTPPMSAPRLATTILLLRDAATRSGMEVFMLQRHRRSGFLPSAWVFPGGRVDPGDGRVQRYEGGETAIELLGGDRDQAIATLVAGIRETFEESGIWLGTNPPPDHTREPLNRGDIAFTELLETHDSTLAFDDVVPWSWWITPEAEPRRYDTRFLVARSDEEGRHDDLETTDSRWICPAAALELGQAGFPLAPPTWWSLVELTRAGDVDAVFASAPARPRRPIVPEMRFDADGMELLLPGHPEHPAPAFPDLPHLVRNEARRWVGYRDGQPVTVGSNATP